jgi:ABC-2 type transport system permease protein
MSATQTFLMAVRRPPLMQTLKTYAEFVRIGFVNILAFRLRYYTGIITYLINVTVYYFIWRAVFANATGPIAGFSLPQILTYVSVGWIIRSFYWNTIDQEMAYEVIEGKIAMDFIKPVSVQGMWLARAMGESAFRLILLTAPTAIIVTLLFPVLPPASHLNFALFLVAALGSFFIMGALNFIIGTCAIPLTSILALIRAKFWLIELLSGLLIPLIFFPRPVRVVSSWLPFEHIAYTPLQIYLGRLTLAETLRLLAVEYFWVIALLYLGHVWWMRATRKITIHGG